MKRGRFPYRYARQELASGSGRSPVAGAIGGAPPLYFDDSRGCTGRVRVVEGPRVPRFREDEDDGCVRCCLA